MGAARIAVVKSTTIRLGRYFIVSSINNDGGRRFVTRGERTVKGCPSSVFRDAKYYDQNKGKEKYKPSKCGPVILVASTNIACICYC